MKVRYAEARVCDDPYTDFNLDAHIPVELQGDILNQFEAEFRETKEEERVPTPKSLVSIVMDVISDALPDFTEDAPEPPEPVNLERAGTINDIGREIELAGILPGELVAIIRLEDLNRLRELAEKAEAESRRE